jgi:hypothetical protein
MQIDSGTLKAVQDDGADFARFFAEFAERTFAQAGLKPTLSIQRLDEAHGAWCNDLRRVEDREKNLTDGLDHYKQAGHLAFWLRRFCPVIDSICMLNGATPNVEQESWRGYLYSYSNEHLAFLLGFNICRFYEKFRSNRYDAPRAFEVKVNGEYLTTICHFLKYKTVSPHAMTMIYKSIFLP